MRIRQNSVNRLGFLYVFCFHMFSLYPTAFQENIDQVGKGITRVPWLPSQQEVRTQIENEAATKSEQGRAAAEHFRQVQAAGTGQYRNAIGHQMTVGQEAYDNATKRFLGTVSKVYPDGSYDVSR